MAIRISLFRFDFFIILSTILFINEAKEYAPVVEIEAGKIRGLVQPLEGVSGGKIHFYQGIRYATANRFEKPKLVDRFQEDVYDATKDGYSCQPFLTGSFDLDKFHKTEKSDDCLFLNIFKPIAKTSSGDDRLLPVMVWIYGGGFQTGTIFTPIYDGSYLAAMGDVIVVTINYRLGVLGFLYTGTEDAPGNQGFHDQLTALKWVQKNIQAFGGDPKQVTIFGESAGSWSVSALVLSPLAQGLFKRAILQSGAIAPSARFSTKQDNLQKSMEFAQKIGCKTDDIGEMLKCLRSKSLEEIKEFGSVDVRQMMSNQAIQPMVGDDFLPEDSMRFRGHVNKANLLFGVTKDEGSMFVPHFVPELNDDQAKFSMEQVKEKIFDILKMYHLDKPEEVVEFYTKDLDASDLGQVRKMFSNFYGDFRFNCPVMLFGKQIAMKTGQEHQFYSYRFDRRAFAADMMQCTKWMGVCHAAEILYVFGYPQIKLFPKDYKLSQDVMRAWINFAKTGQPGQIANTEWLQAFDETLTTNRVMSLDVEYKMLQDPFKEACESLWEKKLVNWQPKLATKQEL